MEIHKVNNISANDKSLLQDGNFFCYNCIYYSATSFCRNKFYRLGGNFVYSLYISMCPSSSHFHFLIINQIRVSSLIAEFLLYKYILIILLLLNLHISKFFLQFTFRVALQRPRPTHFLPYDIYSMPETVIYHLYLLTFITVLGDIVPPSQTVILYMASP